MSRAALGALIAGGRARRLDGRPKGLLSVAGVPIIDGLAALLAEACDRVLIVGDPEGPYAGRGLPVVADLLDGGAPGGVYTALRAAQAPGWVYTVACDMPRLDRATVGRLWALRGGRVTLFRAGGRLQPLAALWHTDAIPVFEAAFAEGRPGFSPLVARLEPVIVEAAAGGPLDDVDTPADAARLRVALD